MFVYQVLAVVALIQGTLCFPEIFDVKGEANFRSINLHWKSKDLPKESLGFLITYCEDQSWGRYRCKEKVIDNAIDSEVTLNTTQPRNNIDLFESTIEGLRLSTNYTVEILPTIDGSPDPVPQRARAIDGNLFITTKGFYARAINCLANSSMVEIETGPYFGGKISVEGNTDSHCSTEGNSSPQSTYLLSINHVVCGSEMNRTSVRSFIIVQENLPILTHSTRRFMVVCSYVPETFTVRAGVNLPDYVDYGNNLVPIGNDVSEVDPSELFDSTNNLLSSRQAKQISKPLKFSAEKGQKVEQKWAHLVLMIVLVMSTVVGISCAVVHFIRRSRLKNRNGFVSQQNDPSSNDPENADSSFGDLVTSSNGSLSSDDTPPLNGIDFDLRTTPIDLTSSQPDIDLLTPSLKCQQVPNNDKVDIMTNIPSNNSTSDPIASNIPADNPQQTVIGNLPCPQGDIMDTSPSMTPSVNSMPSFIPGNHCLSVPLTNLENIDAVFDQILNPDNSLVNPTFTTFFPTNHVQESNTDLQGQTGQLPPPTTCQQLNQSDANTFKGEKVESNNVAEKSSRDISTEESSTNEFVVVNI